MKTAEEILYRVCHDHPSGNRGDDHIMPEFCVKAMKEYARIKCKEQRKLCAETAESNEKAETGEPLTDYLWASILYCKEPNFD